MTSLKKTAATRWNHERYRAEALRLALERILSRVGATLSHAHASAIVLPDGRPLHQRAPNPVDFATLPHAARLCFQYLRLRDGDVALLNEPFAGGTRLSDMTFVSAVAFSATDDDRRDGQRDAKREPDLLIALRAHLPPRLSLDESLDAEGVRIPPTPLGTTSAPNAGLLQAIASHPLAPQDFVAVASLAVAELRALAQRLRAAAQDPRSEVKPESFASYLREEAAAFHESVARLPLGRALVAETFESGETLKLALDVREASVSFDFAGSDASPNLQLTDRATFGACFAAVCRAAHSPIEANAGAFASVEVRSVPGTMVNAKAPSGIGRGALDLSTAVSELALRAFGQNRATLRRAASARGFSRWQIKFDDGRALADGAFGGSGAAPNATGRHAAALEWALGDSIASVERAEKAFPILFQTRAPRAGSGGAGQQRGGNGQLISFTVLAPALFSWSLRHAEARIAGLDGGKSGLPADATIARAPLAQAGGAQAAGAGAKREALPAAGEIRLAAGDTILVRTAGGGGFGEIAAVKADEED